MAMNTRMKGLMDQTGVAPAQQPFATVGTVVDTNDPQGMGRLRVVCPQWGDTWSSEVEALPWAIYMSPFGGQMQVGTRGPGIQESEGSVAYGLWAIPKVGAQVAIMCIDGNPMTRMWFGCVYDQFTPHTMPHGRFMYDDHPELEKEGASPAPYGPYTSSEKYIQPLADNLKQQFGHEDEPNFEYRTRGADYTVSRVSVDQLDQTYSAVADDAGAVHDGWTSTQGYQASRTDPLAGSSLTDKNYDSLTYSMTTPGFHSLSMDDRQENCRVRIRTTSGHQILMDDTNERIYIATAHGNNWIELDQAGNVDVYTSSKFSVHAAKEINFTSDESIRMHAKKGIHLHSETEISLNAKTDLNIKTLNLRSHATSSFLIQSDGDFSVKTSGNLVLDAASNMGFKAGDVIASTAGGDIGITGANVSITGGAINLNGPQGPDADAAGAAQPAGEQEALWTNRVPQHEPFARTMTKTDKTHEPEFPYDDARVNKVERGQLIERGLYWRR